uniref:Glycine rich superfamily member n=1 Tax=Rhipicephalus appendiculatus TaxID=34631 RepID=A0A131YD01_RHIAP
MALHSTMIRFCLLLALATCAFAVYSGNPYGYYVGAPGPYAAYNAPLGSLSPYGYGLDHGAPSYGYGIGSYGLGYGPGLGGLGYTTVHQKK